MSRGVVLRLFVFILLRKDNILSKDFVNKFSEAFEHAKLITTVLFGTKRKFNDFHFTETEVLFTDYDDWSKIPMPEQFSFPLSYLAMSCGEIEEMERVNGEKTRLAIEESLKKRKERDIEMAKEDFAHHKELMERNRDYYKELTGEELE